MVLTIVINKKNGLDYVIKIKKNLTVEDLLDCKNKLLLSNNFAV